LLVVVLDLLDLVALGIFAGYLPAQAVLTTAGVTAKLFHWHPTGDKTKA
jgi:hypothetical protein